MKTLVIINPASGSSDDDFRALVESELKNHSAEFEIRTTDPEKGGEEIAREAVAGGVTHLIACGGDGTVMSVVNGMGHAEIEEKQPRQPNAILSIVPGGTANLLAGALGIPTDTKEAVAVAINGIEKEIDLGKCGETVFALGVGLGLTERLVSEASAEQKEKIGKLAYAIAMLRELGAKPTTFSFKLDNGKKRTARGVAVVIANAGQIGGGLAFAPDAKMDDGRLDLCILRRFYLRDFLRMLWHALRGNLPADRAVAFYQARRIEIRSDPPLDLQIDGEVVDLTTPLVAGVLPKALRVRVPAEKVHSSP
jgi:YegS/Rv2252/BmrU family lipid kinase